MRYYNATQISCPVRHARTCQLHLSRQTSSWSLSPLEATPSQNDHDSTDKEHPVLLLVLQYYLGCLCFLKLLVIRKTGRL